MLKRYVVVYMYYGIHQRFRCSAKNARAARKECRQSLGIANKDIVDVYEEGIS